MAKIIGGAAVTPMKIADLGQTDPKKSDFIKNKQLISNAIKETVSGNPIRIDDSSPFEHEVKVGVESKNLFDSSLFSAWFDKQEDGSYLSNQYISIDCKVPFYLPKGTYAFSLMLKSPSGKDYRICVVYEDGTKNSSFLYKSSNGEYQLHSATLTTTKAITDIYFGYAGQSNEVQFKDFQIEEGTTISAYTPFVDLNGWEEVFHNVDTLSLDGTLSLDVRYTVADIKKEYSEDDEMYVVTATLEEKSSDGENLSFSYVQYTDESYEPPFKIGDKVIFHESKISGFIFEFLYVIKPKKNFVGATVQKYGKNLFQYDAKDVNPDHCKVIEQLENGVIVQGEAGSSPGLSNGGNGWFVVANSGFKVMRGVSYIVSCDFTFIEDPYRPSDVTQTANRFNIGVSAIGEGTGGGDSTSYFRPAVGVKEKIYRQFTPQCDSVKLTFKACSGTIKIENIMIEVGKVNTDFEPFHSTPHTADENGNVSGIVANGEDMTLIADSGITISAEYSVDTKKYIDKKFAELQALVLEV